jgi:hypothetical protein
MLIKETTVTEEGIHLFSDGTAIIFKKSMLSGKMHKAIMRITNKQYNRWINSGELIQDIFPHLTAEEREFLMTGSTPEEWNQTFKNEEEDE